MSRDCRLVPVLLATALACSGAPRSEPVSESERRAISEEITGLLRSTYTFEGDSIVERFMRLYPDSGRVVSAASGAFTTTRDSLESALGRFWEGAGKFMVRPSWTWGDIVVDVLSRDAAVVTARYTVPHWTPDGNPHVLGGAWTSVWSRRDGRWVIVQEHLSDLPRAVAERLEAEIPVLKDTVRNP